MHSVDVLFCKHARTYDATANACSNFASNCAFTECITAGLTAVTQSALATAHAARSCLLQTNHTGRVRRVASPTDRRPMDAWMTRSVRSSMQSRRQTLLIFFVFFLLGDPVSLFLNSYGFWTSFWFQTVDRDLS